MKIRVRDIILFARSEPNNGPQIIARMYDWKHRESLLFLQITCGVAVGLFIGLFIAILRDEIAFLPHLSPNLPLFFAALITVILAILYQFRRTTRIGQEYAFATRLFSRLIDIQKGGL